MSVKLLTEHHLECLSLKGGCRGSFESTHVKMPHCWKYHALAYLVPRDTLLWGKMPVPIQNVICMSIKTRALFLAHLSRRLRGELLVYQ